MPGIVHIAGLDIQVNNLLRQRCAWCGETLIDYDLACTASPCGEKCATDECLPEYHMPATWPVGALVEVDGPVSFVVAHEDGRQLPDNACERIVAEVMS